MQRDNLELLLKRVQSGEMNTDDALKQLKTLPFTDMGFAMIDNHRAIRVGYPEVIYSEGKTVEQVTAIVEHLCESGVNVLATRATEEMFEAVHSSNTKAKYNAIGRTITVINSALQESESYIAIVAAGTSDLPVVEEAYETARILGNRVEKVIDVGIAGIHRLFAKLDVIRGARVVIVIAGMEGALASVVGGLVDKPVIAVPTSVGYGASFGGISALLTMLNSCASGVTVVNIDNGFGAAYSASIINQLK
ncbi:MAG: nickel pincer cofactor biosynthesis protein LarB [Clostridia bacterium]|nr:nickel pincer cofactor biosynthesis protein LarB [Clostridia bacterium]